MRNGLWEKIAADHRREFLSMKILNGGYGIGWKILLTPSPCLSEGRVGERSNVSPLAPPLET